MAHIQGMIQCTNWLRPNYFTLKLYLWLVVARSASHWTQPPVCPFPYGTEHSRKVWSAHLGLGAHHPHCAVAFCYFSKEFVTSPEKPVVSHVSLKVCIFFFFFFFGTGVWTQGLHSEPLHQPFFVIGFFPDRVLRTICLSWPRTVIHLIFASWVARITGVSPTGAWLDVCF
jgi:hypothetical protein